MEPLPQAPAGRGAARAPVPARAGIGLRPPHHGRILAERPPLAWLEVHPENHLGRGSAAEEFDAIASDYPLSLHAVGLSLGSAEGIDAAHLNAIAALAERLQPGLVSDHLSWSAAGGVHLPDLLPLPYTEEALDVVCRNLERVQTTLGRSILVENPSAYLRFADAQLSEAKFLAELVRRSGCGVLLDVNNLFVSASNLGEAPLANLIELLACVPHAAIGEIHLAGHATRALPDGRLLRIDDHGSRVAAGVWALYDAAIALLGPRPTLIEWDTAIPPLETLIDEARAADAILQASRQEARHAAA
jgi:uncharacterized protein (UPF0276 family)